MSHFYTITSSLNLIPHPQFLLNSQRLLNQYGRSKLRTIIRNIKLPSHKLQLRMLPTHTHISNPHLTRTLSPDQHHLPLFLIRIHLHNMNSSVWCRCKRLELQRPFVKLLVFKIQHWELSAPLPVLHSQFLLAQLTDQVFPVVRFDSWIDFRMNLAGNPFS